MAGLALPKPSTFLHEGQMFTGTETSESEKLNFDVSVNVTLHKWNIEQRYLCGNMHRRGGKPPAEFNLVTFWEGEIVGGKKYLFTTDKWDVSRATDAEYWRKFESFSQLCKAVHALRDRRVLLGEYLMNYPFMFMRWKETSVLSVNGGPDGNVRVSGFYYVCMSLTDGSVKAFMYDPDPDNKCFQTLELTATIGVGHPIFDLALLPELCTFLKKGQVFKGSEQNFNTTKIDVTLEGCDIEQGQLSGYLTAFSDIEQRFLRYFSESEEKLKRKMFWEGEIVGKKDFSFFTRRWGVSEEKDLENWAKFPEFLSLEEAVQTDGGRALKLANYSFVFMRWKVRDYVNFSTNGRAVRTEGRFFYVCFSKRDRSLKGFLYPDVDPDSNHPFPKLDFIATMQ